MTMAKTTPALMNSKIIRKCWKEWWNKSILDRGEKEKKIR